jgi:hypothetical protein
MAPASQKLGHAAGDGKAEFSGSNTADSFCDRSPGGRLPSRNNYGASKEFGAPVSFHGHCNNTI